MDCLRHRLIVSFEAEAAGINSDDVVARLIERVPVARQHDRAQDHRPEGALVTAEALIASRFTARFIDVTGQSVRSPTGRQRARQRGGAWNSTGTCLRGGRRREGHRLARHGALAHPIPNFFMKTASNRFGSGRPACVDEVWLNALLQIGHGSAYRRGHAVVGTQAGERIGGAVPATVCSRYPAEAEPARRAKHDWRPHVRRSSRSQFSGG